MDVPPIPPCPVTPAGVVTVSGPIASRRPVCPSISVRAAVTVVMASRSAVAARSITASVSGADPALARITRASARKSAMIWSTLRAARALVACASASTDR
ncbi:Uncharacterised protein [Mycobacteroides abscessus subsp. abscessus]|nr:Uncharacterised protein [Mycobacteroides abscessus subsp. abscessus]